MNDGLCIRIAIELNEIRERHPLIENLQRTRCYVQRKASFSWSQTKNHKVTCISRGTSMVRYTYHVVAMV